MHIKIKKGLDIPITGKPNGIAKPLAPVGFLALNLNPFDDIPFRLLTKAGDHVKIGQPLAEDKNCSGRYFVSPAAGIVAECRRGPKRRLLDIVIQVDPVEEYYLHKTENTIDALKSGGIFANIRSRPFNRLADPHKTPRNIFVKAVESAPFVPPAEMQVEGYEKEFQIGLTALSKLTSGAVHLVAHKNSPLFGNVKDVQKHTVEGPHPVSNHSLHIQEIDPVVNAEDNIWTLNAHDVVSIGVLLSTGKIHTQKIIGIGGPGILPEKTGYFKVRLGCPIEALTHNRLTEEPVRLISGDPLMGQKVSLNDFLGYYHFALSAIPEPKERKFLHFLRFNHKSKEHTTSLHGEERAFIDGSFYDRVMPLHVPTMMLVKAIMAKDYDRAVELGLLDVDAEDFALPSFVCPSKIEMTEIVRHGLCAYLDI